MTLKVKNVPIKRWWDFWIALSILAAISSVAMRLWATEWTGNLHILVYLAFIAGVTGIALGYSQFSPLVAALFSTVYGIFTIGWLFGTTIEIEMTWHDRILNYLMWRLRNAIQQFNAGDTVADPILFLTIMAVLLWILASVATLILIRRGTVWPSIIPLGLTLLVISHYDQDLARNTRFLMTFLFFTFLIVGRMTFLHNRQKWRQEGIHTTMETQLDFSRALISLVIILLILSWVIPATPQQVRRYSALWDTITEPWDWLNDELSNIFIANTHNSTLSSSFFGESMRLGTGSPAEEKVIMTVHPENEELPGYRNYWRARSYDFYNNANWSSSPMLPEKLLFPDDFLIQYPEWKTGQRVSYTFTSNMDRMINIYTTGVPTWVNRPVEAVIHPLSDSENDLIALTADPDLRNGETYQIESRVNIPTITELRNASTEYPEWLERYLQLPANFSPDIQALAAEITTDLDTAYDKTYAITRYLRANIDYSRSLPPVPVGADPLEWFLFDEQIGFCNYYATAEILMLRSLGIPARLAVGYAEGEYDRESNSYIVRKQDSHAWPEVYFMDYGWVVFEPTVSQSAVVLPAGEVETNPAPTPFAAGELTRDLPLPPSEFDTSPGILPEMDGGVLPTTIPPEPFQRIGSATVPLTILSLFVIALLVALFIFMRPAWFKINIDPLPVLLERTLVRRGKEVPEWLRRWSYLAQMSVAERAYLQLGRSIKVLGQPLNPSQTPSERAQTLTGLLPDTNDPVQDILHEYHLDKFSNHIVNEERAKNAARKVRGMALKARVLRFFQFENTKK